MDLIGAFGDLGSTMELSRHASGSVPDVGLRTLTGLVDGPALAVPGDPVGLAQAFLDVAEDHLAPSASVWPDARVLTERAAIAGFTRQGAISCGGASRILAAEDGWVAVTLAREWDFEALPALIRTGVEDPWTDLTRWCARHPATAIEEQAATLDIAAASIPSARDRRRTPVVGVRGAKLRKTPARLRVLDISALWAGPLCAHLLGLTGADVVKFESTSRPDGARWGNTHFFDLLNQKHRMVALDMQRGDQRRALRKLALNADVVVASSRVRALDRLGLDPRDLAERGVTVVRISASGHDAEWERIGFGDDVAAGAGLVATSDSGPVFVGDAIADPMGGLAAAAAVSLAMSSGFAWSLDVSLHDVSRFALEQEESVNEDVAVQPSIARMPQGRAARIGAHTREVMEEWSRPPQCEDHAS